MSLIMSLFADAYDVVEPAATPTYYSKHMHRLTVYLWVQGCKLMTTEWIYAHAPAQNSNQLHIAATAI